MFEKLDVKSVESPDDENGSIIGESTYALGFFSK